MVPVKERDEESSSMLCCIACSRGNRNSGLLVGYTLFPKNGPELP